MRKTRGVNMNEAALKKHAIYGKLSRLSGAELNSVADFIDFVQHKKQQTPKKKVIKLHGILADYDLDLAGLKEFKKKSWKHLEGEFENE
jgi:hypothetical protein